MNATRPVATPLIAVALLAGCASDTDDDTPQDDDTETTDEDETED